MLQPDAGVVQCLHHTAHRHIDALATGAEFTAVATSSLTGDVWDGALALLSAHGGACALSEQSAATRANPCVHSLVFYSAFMSRTAHV